MYIRVTKPIGVDVLNIREEARQLLSSTVQINSLMNLTRVLRITSESGMSNNAYIASPGVTSLFLFL